MQEIVATLRFITPCLGCVRDPKCDRFEKDADGNVVIMNSRWWHILDYGAKAFGKHQALVRQIRFHPKVEGVPRRFERHWGSDKSTWHEAFLAKQVIRVQAMLPDGISEQGFAEIMRLAGAYRGISPYGWQRGYGLFDVVSVTPAQRHRQSDKGE